MAEHGPVLSVHPSSCLVDEKTEVEVKHLPAGYKITLHALIHSEDGDDWEATPATPQGLLKVHYFILNHHTSQVWF